MRISIKEINRYNIVGLVLCLHLAFTQDGQKSIYTQSLPQDSNNDIITALPNNIPTKKKNIEFIYDFDYGFFADNLEDSQDYWATRTLFAQSLAPRVGISFFNQNILVGGYFIINMGEKYPINANSGIGGYGLSLHYDVAYNNFKAYFGIFSRKYWLGDYPKLYYRDDFMFFNPMTNGMLFQYAKANAKGDSQFSAEFLIDWYGGNIQKRIDEFLVQAFLQQDFFNKLLYFGGSLLLYHTKNPEILNPNSNVLDVFLLDRFYYNIYLGSNLISVMPYMDKANIKLGVLSSIERKRRESTGPDPFSHTPGAELSLEFQYKGFGIFNNFYIGDKHYRYFVEYGDGLYSGLPFYRANIYDRLEAYYEYKNDYLRARFSLIFHITHDNVTPKGNFAHQQMLSISLDTQRLLSKLLRH